MRSSSEQPLQRPRAAADVAPAGERLVDLARLVAPDQAHRTALAFGAPVLEAIPRATSTVRIFQQVGGSFGTALLAVILQHQAANLARTGPASLTTAFGHTFWWAVGFTALALIPALFLPRGRPKPAAPSYEATAPAQA